MSEGYPGQDLWRGLGFVAALFGAAALLMALGKAVAMVVAGRVRPPKPAERRQPAAAIVIFGAVLVVGVVLYLGRTYWAW